MTRIAGTYIVRTPCCGRSYGTTAYASINYSAWEYWTDGQDYMGLAPPMDGLRGCSCGSFFLLERTQQIGFVPRRRFNHPNHNVIPLMQRLSERTSQWMRAMFGLKDDPASARRAASSELLPDDDKEPEVPEYAPPVRNEDLRRVIALSVDDPVMQAIARARLWRHLNDPYREVYRKHRDGGAQDFPAFEPTDEQAANMRALLNLLQQQEGASRLEKAELLRELGDLDAARAMLGEVSPESPYIARVIQECLNENFNGPARYRL